LPKFPSFSEEIPRIRLAFANCVFAVRNEMRVIHFEAAIHFDVAVISQQRR
jgi:hypothetical protein